jgi:hypothetical protein
VHFQRADTLQGLYFPSVESYQEAYFNTLIRFVEWLDNYVELQAEDSSHWSEQFYADTTEKWRLLHDV